MQKVLDYLKDNQSRFLEELCDYIRFPSVSAQPHHREDMLRCANWLENHCRQIGLTSEIVETPGHPIVVAKTKKEPGKPNFLVYGHYDVQPAEPLDLWTTEPFVPRLEGRSLFARGASDNKGQNFAHLKAIEAYLKTGTDLPCNLTVVIEGEEEVGSTHLADFLKARKDDLQCDAVVISDTGMPAKNIPALVYALRGIVALEIKVTGPSRDLHSGIFGGTVDNPAMVLSQILAGLRDKKGRITVPGLYEDVLKLSKYERQQFDKIPLNEKTYRKFLGVKELFGETGYSFLEQRSSRPTCEINGLTSGYQGHGSKTIIPSWASAKLTFRLVPNQDPRKLFKQISAHMKKACPPTVRLEITEGHHGKPYLVSPDGRLAQAALRSLRTAFGKPPILMREGGSIPIVTSFKKILGADTLLVGLALPDDNAHSPNEKFDLDIFEHGMALGASLWQELAKP